MKPILFPEASGFLPATRISEDGKPEPVNYHFYANPKGKLNITCIEVSDEDIEQLKQTKKFFLILPGPVPAPFTMQVNTPFVPKQAVILDGNGNAYMKSNNDGKANQSQEGPGNDEQHHDGDSELSQLRGPLSE